MAQLTANQTVVLCMVAEALSEGRVVPKLGAIAARLRVRNAVIVAFVLRELQELGLVEGAPPVGATTTHYVDLTVAGWEQAGDLRPLPAATEAAFSAPPQKRTGYVVEIAWRCDACGAATIDTRKPCRMCPLLAAANVEPIVFEPKQGAA